MTDAEKAAKKQKRDILITSVLLLVFAYTFTTNILFPAKKKAAPVAAVANTNISQDMSEQLVVVTNIRLYDTLRNDRLKLWDREWARDPFSPQQTVSSVVKAVNMTLKGILWDDVTPKAIVNDKTLIEGDTLYGYTVVAIKPRSVILKTGEKNIELSVFSPILSDSAPTS